MENRHWRRQQRRGIDSPRAGVMDRTPEKISELHVVISVAEFSKRFGDSLAVNRLSFDVW